MRRTGTAAFKAARAMFVPETPRDAGAISYFALFALFPAILVLIAIVDSVLGWVNLHDRVLQSILSLFPGSKAFLEGNLSEITDPSPALFFSCFVVVVWSSTWIFTSVENALNRAWNVKRRRSFWESRIRSIALLVLGGILLLTSAGITAAVSTLRSRALRRLPEFAQQDEIINWLWSSVFLSIGFAIAIVVFFSIYKLMPDRKVFWSEALSGAIVAATVWEVGSYLFAKMVPVLDPQQVYGKTAAIILLLIWIYTSSLIMLFGANFSAKLHQPLDRDDSLPGLRIAESREKTNWEKKIRSFPLVR